MRTLQHGPTRLRILTSCRALIFSLLLAADHVQAIPQESEDGGLSINAFENAEAAVTTNLVRYFNQNATPPAGPGATLTFQQAQSTNPAPLWNQETSKSFKVIGNYSERFSNMDVDQLVSGIVTNEVLIQEQIAQLPLDPDTLHRDLNPATNDEPSVQLLRQIRETLAADQSKSSAEEIKGLRLALTYLAMAAVIIVVIFARR